MITLAIALCSIILLAIIIAIYQKSTNAVCESKKKLNGKVAIVTGGTAGMGYEVAKDFANRGAKVIIASPFKPEGEKAEKKIKEETSNNDITFKELDLASLKSVREFAKDILATGERLDILVNNAGVGIPGDFPTVDGLNFIMQVNYYGHFLLTLLLLPLLKKSGTAEDRSRIVNVSSLLHWLGSKDFINMNKPGYWCTLQIYGNSKLCLALFAHELSKKLNESDVVINSLDPGAVGTRIFDSMNIILGSITTFVAGSVFKTPWQGAQTTLHVALDDAAGKNSGQFFKNCKLITARPAAYNDEAGKRLWEESKRCVKLNKEEVDTSLKNQ